jgi:hypothetical protein
MALSQSEKLTCLGSSGSDEIFDCKTMLR